MTATVLDCPLLEVLLRSRQPLGVPELAQRIGGNEAQVRQSLSRLQRAGCRMVDLPGSSVQLERTSLEVWQDHVRWATRCPQRTVAVFRRTSSTQDVVRRLIRSLGPAADGAMAVADVQDQGRGRLGRAWVAPPASAVLVSRAWFPEGADAQGLVDQCTLATAVAAAEAIEDAAGGRVELQIKWPNDLLIDGRKLAGILIETMVCDGRTSAIIGIGVNVHLQARQVPDELRGRITSLAMAGCPTDRLAVLAALATKLDRALQFPHEGRLLNEWRRRSTLLGRRVAVQCDGTIYRGRVLDLDARDGLILRTDDGAFIHLPAATSTLAHDGASSGD
jgi:BirA family biotin operon repressor/biotin-[acetyl-CoA-carboxylase] ligase